MLEVADLKYKAIILTYASTGMRRAALAELKLSDIKKVVGTLMVENKNSIKKEIYMFEVYSSSIKDRHITFCTPECSDAIDTYLASRERSGEKLLPTSPLFRTDFDKRRPILSFKKPAEHLTAATIGDRMRNIAITAGVITPVHYSNNHQNGKRRNQVASIHGFRKFAITQMGRGRVNPEIREMMVGHNQAIKEVYLKYTTEDLLNEYVKAIDFLTISEENRLKTKVMVLTEEKNNEIDTLRKHLDETNKNIDDVVADVKKFMQSNEQLLEYMRKPDASQEKVKKLTEEVESLKREQQRKYNLPTTN
jgi:integrase